MSVLRKLSFRLAAPILLVAALLWVVLYFFVAQTVRGFAHDRGQEDLRSVSREVLNICNTKFDTVIQSGLLNNPREVRVAKAVTLGELEDFFWEFKLEGIIYEGKDSTRQLAMHTLDENAVQSDVGLNDGSHRLFTVQVHGKRFFAYGIDFQPWQWHIVLLRPTDSYSGLAGKIRGLYWTTGVLLLVMALGLVLVENRLLRRPVDTIIRKLRGGEKPTYEGIEELEFLSRNFAQLMETLVEREERLRESETRYRTIFETTGTAMLVCEEDTTISLANSQFVEYAGYSKEEVEGRKSWTEIVAEDDLDRMKRIHQLRRTDPDAARRQYEFRLVDKLRNYKNMLLTADIIPGTTQSLVSLIDITDRKREELQRRLEQEEQAAEALREKNAQLGREIEARKKIEESLRASEERFRAIFEAADDCVFIKNTQLEYTHVNPAFVKLLERPVEDIIGKDDRALGLDADYAAHAANLEARVMRGETFETTHTLAWKGWPIALNIIRFPLRDPSGTTFGICGIARDVTDRRSGPIRRKRWAVREYPSRASQEIIQCVTLGAESDSTVLFLGESGTGKDYWARYLHDHSHRAGGSFFAINCAALSPELVESELFGYEAGAFTGARGRKRGLLELAEGGTLLLNEIGEMPPAMQSKLLTFLDTQEITRIGGEKSVSVNTRILAATNRDLTKEIESGGFREDLYYRLAVLTITVPTLRERIDDLPMLLDELLSDLAERTGLEKLPAIDPAALEALLRHNWPGNVRELRNVLERAMILGDGEKIVLSDLGLETSKPVVQISESPDPSGTLLPEGGSFLDAVNRTKRFLIVNALEQCGGNVREAAKLLGMTRNSIDHHIRHLGIRK